MTGFRHRRWMAWSCIALLIGQSACATRPYSGIYREDLGTVGVVAAAYAPEVSMRGPGTDGMALGLIGGGALGAVAAAGCTPQPIVVISCSLGLLLAITMGAAGGALIGREVDARKKGDEITSAVESSLPNAEAQERLREHVVRMLRERSSAPITEIVQPRPGSPGDQPDYRGLAAQRIDTVLEIGLQRVGLQAPSKERIAPVMLTRLRLVRVADGAVLLDTTHRYRGDFRTYTSWTDKEAEILRASLDLAYRALAEQAVATVSGDKATSGQGVATIEAAQGSAAARRAEGQGPMTAIPHADVVMRPVYPELSWCLVCHSGKGVGGIEFVELDTPAPILRWEPYHAGDQNVSYGIALFIAELDASAGVWIPGRRVYEREGLSQPNHRLESRLEPCTRYFWTFRARAETEAGVKLTGWMSEYPRRPDAPHAPGRTSLWETLGSLRRLLPGPKELVDLEKLPSSYYYRFVTPAVQGSPGCP